jgi:hypothetical protein
LVWGGSNLIFSNLDISGFQKAGIGIYGCNSAVVRLVDAHDNGSAGIEVGGQGDVRSNAIMILDCRSWSNPGDPTNFENHSGNGIVVGQSNNVTVKGCVAWDNGADMPRVGNGPVGIWAWEADSVVIEGCISYGNHTSKGSSDGGGFDLDGGVTHARVHHNLSYGNEGSGIGIFQYLGASNWGDNFIDHNYSIDDATTTLGSASVLVWSSDTSAGKMRGLDFGFNVIVNHRTELFRYHEDSRHQPFFIHDNIFFGPGPVPTGQYQLDTLSRNKWCLAGTSKTLISIDTTNGIIRLPKGCAVPKYLDQLKTIKDASQWRVWMKEHGVDYGLKPKI